LQGISFVSHDFVARIFGLGRRGRAFEGLRRERGKGISHPRSFALPFSPPPSPSLSSCKGCQKKNGKEKEKRLKSVPSPEGRRREEESSIILIMT